MLLYLKIWFFLNMFTKINESINNFDRFLKSDLNLQNPSEPSASIRRDNLEILVREIFGRVLLLIIRFGKCVSSVISFVASPLSLLHSGKQFNPPEIAWKTFCKEIRYLTAESFEAVGVIAFSILLLPFNRQHSSHLMNAQICVEKTAEWISGEKGDIDNIQTTLNSATTMSHLLLQARQITGVSQDEIDKWNDIEKEFYIDIVDVKWRMSHRRIARGYSRAYQLKEVLDNKLKDHDSLVSERLAPMVISHQQHILSQLKKLQNTSRPESEGFDNSTQPSPTLESFRALSLEISKTIDVLHRLHDPESIIKNKLDNLDKCQSEFFNQVYHDAIRSDIIKLGGLGGLWKSYNLHFINVMKQRDEIEYIFSYRNVTEGDDVFSNSFVTDLTEQIDQCQKMFNAARLTWNAIKPGSLDKRQALIILGLTDPASLEEITKSYRKLALIHHPDKGGQAHVFNIIKEAYDFLIQNTR